MDRKRRSAGHELFAESSSATAHHSSTPSTSAAAAAVGEKGAAAAAALPSTSHAGHGAAGENGGMQDAAKKGKIEEFPLLMETLDLDSLLGIPSSPTGSSSLMGNDSGRFYSARVKTGVPLKNDASVMRKIYDIVAMHYKENMGAKHIIFTKEANVRACWPVCALTMRGNVTGQSMMEISPGEQKFFAIQLPPVSSEPNMETQFFLFKQAHRDAFPLKLNQKSIFNIIEHSNRLYEYLRSIEDSSIAFGEGLPSSNKPEPFEIEVSSDGKSKIILQIDEIDVKRRMSRISPTVSIRMMRKSLTDSSLWFPDKAGVTLSAGNFFFFVEATLKTFLPQMQEMVRDFRDIFMANGGQFEEMAKEQL